MAARQWYGDDAALEYCTSFSDVFNALDSGRANAIVTAVENTIYGSINQVYSLIEQCQLPIVGEIKLPIHQQLIALPGASLENIEAVYSHPVALAQCRDFLSANLPHAQAIEYFDTAGAVEFIKQQNDPTRAAIAAAQAATLHALPILARDIDDSAHNITRFLVLDRTPSSSLATRCSLVVTTDHQPGALMRVLSIFAEERINIVKLQSQPILDKPWQYKFFIVADTAGSQLAALIDRLERTSTSIKLLGEYPAQN